MENYTMGITNTNLEYSYIQKEKFSQFVMHIENVLEVLNNTKIQWYPRYEVRHHGSKINCIIKAAYRYKIPESVNNFTVWLPIFIFEKIVIKLLP